VVGFGLVTVPLLDGAVVAPDRILDRPASELEVGEVVQSQRVLRIEPQCRQHGLLGLRESPLHDEAPGDRVYGERIVGLQGGEGARRSFRPRRISEMRSDAEAVRVPEGYHRPRVGLVGRSYMAATRT
jgi:hypothetical protein